MNAPCNGKAVLLDQQMYLLPEQLSYVLWQRNPRGELLSRQGTKLRPAYLRGHRVQYGLFLDLSLCLSETNNKWLSFHN